MEKTLAIIITEDKNVTTTQYIGDKSLLAEHAKTMAYDIIEGRFNH